ncbi:alpha/beta fold hydrolase [Chitinimonas naiadis]
MMIAPSFHAPSRALSVLGMVSLLLAGCAAMPTTATHRTTEGVLAYTRIGDGRPTVVLQSGLGDGKSAWTNLISRLSPRYTVLAYDRPGYGDSSASTAPRDACTVASELHTLLHAEGVPPPYVLVGHSLGGLYQYAYARLYPDEVSGLVLVDATHPKHWQHLQADAPKTAAVLSGMRATVFSPIMRREFDAQDQCVDRLAALAPLRMPVRVLTKTRYELYERGAFEAVVHADEQDWLRLTGATRVEPVEGAGHYIQNDDPAAVLRAIGAVAVPVSATHQ